MSIKKAEFYTDYKSVEIFWKKKYIEKGIFQKLLQVDSIERKNFNFAHLFCL